MKKIAIISGKGGTGKTLVTSCLATLARNKVMVDCDVDAANLQILLKAVEEEEHAFVSSQTAIIAHPENCKGCGFCVQKCRFNALEMTPDGVRILPYACEGCGLCARICPSKVFVMKKVQDGRWFFSSSSYGPFFHAELEPGGENSGKLVLAIRKASENYAEKHCFDYVLIDGPPGTGCPVMATLTGVDQVVIVTEPTCSGIADMKRAADIAAHFKLPVCIVINKYTLNTDQAETIEALAQENDWTIGAKIAFNKSIFNAIGQARFPTREEVPQLFDAVDQLWNYLK